MKKELQEKALQALERQERQYKRQNDFIKNKYDRQSLTMPIGTKDAIRERGETVNGVINKLLKLWLDGKIDLPEEDK